MPFAIKKASDQAGVALVAAFNAEWRKKLKQKRTTFPKRVLRVLRARVTGEHISRNTRVVSVGGDEVLSLQIRGGTKRPRGKALLVPPSSSRRKPRKGQKRYSAGKYLFKPNKGRRKDAYVGHLESTVHVKRRFSERRILERTRVILPRLVRSELRKETRAQLRRLGRA